MAKKKAKRRPPDLVPDNLALWDKIAMESGKRIVYSKIPTEPIRRLHYFGQEFLGNVEGLDATGHDLLRQALRCMATPDEANVTYEQRTAEVLRQLTKQVQQLLYNHDCMYEVTGMGRPFGTKGY